MGLSERQITAGLKVSMGAMRRVLHRNLIRCILTHDWTQIDHAIRR